MDACQSRIVDELFARFGLPEAVVEPFTDSVHDNLRVRSGGKSFFMKILNEDYGERKVRSQLEFMDHLRRGGLRVVETVPTSDGKPFAKSADGRSIGILSRWIDGQNVSERQEPEWVERCGELLARVHERASTFQPSSGFAVRAWDGIYAPQPGGWPDRFLAQTAFDDASRNVILDATDRVRSAVQRLGKSGATYGVIHADFHFDNLMFDGTNMWIVDFEDIGWGHFLLDLTWPEALFAKRNEHSAFFESFRTGYERVRPLSDLENALLPGFRLAAGIAVLEMIDTAPIPNASPKAREWLAFAVDWLGKHLPDAKG